MAHIQEELPNEELIQKMKKWGVIKEPVSRMGDRPFDVKNWFLWQYDQSFRQIISETYEKRPITKKVRMLESACISLRQRVQELEGIIGIRREPTKADIIYEEHKDELQREFFGKIIAIDVDAGKIVGVGTSILEAYKEAKAKSDKDKFSYRKVGFDYVHKL